MTRGLFLTATGTDVGKTFVAALIVKTMREAGLNAGYYKAALSGAERLGESLIPGDAAFVAQAAGLPCTPGELVSYVYETAVSPHLAAEIEGNPPKLAVIAADYRQSFRRFDYVLVEGSGGIVCPLRLDDSPLMLTDVIRKLALGIVIVAPASLGSINAAVLTAAYASQAGIETKGFILNRFHPGNRMEEDNRRAIERLTGIPVLACVPENAQTIGIDAANLTPLFSESPGRGEPR